MSSPPNYYEVLNSHPSDSIEEIKKSYQILILKHHPDKQCTSDHTNDIEQFYQIDEAWKILRDPDKRKKYDAELMQHKFDDEPIVHAKVYRNDFDFDSESQSYIYPCRCGGVFNLPDDCIASDVCDTSAKNSSEAPSECSINRTGNETDENQDEIYIECDECSFVIQLLSNSRNKR